jgi:hypothetical protein
MPVAATRRRITRGDILAPADYAALRDQQRRRVIAAKARRRLAVGPVATLQFECFDSVWLQIHEVLRIEMGGDAQIAMGGEAQIADELAAYGGLVPNGREFVATLMFEIADDGRRRALLGRLGGVEDSVTLAFAGHTIAAVPAAGYERSDATGTASAVHFLHFPFTPEQIRAFRLAEAPVVLGIGHAEYGHLAILPLPTCLELAADFD